MFRFYVIIAPLFAKMKKGKVVCPVCDTKYTSSYFKKHKQTKLHQDNIVKSVINEIVLSDSDTEIDTDDHEYEPG